MFVDLYSLIYNSIAIGLAHMDDDVIAELINADLLAKEGIN